MCKDVVHLWTRGTFRKHFESRELQKVKQIIANRDKSIATEKLSESDNEESISALAKAKSFIEDKRVLVGHTGAKCDSNRECLQRKKVPCGFYSDHSESKIKNWIKKIFPKVLVDCWLSDVSGKFNKCTLCTNQVAPKSLGVFWVHVIHYHHDDVGAP